MMASVRQACSLTAPGSQAFRRMPAKTSDARMVARRAGHVTAVVVEGTWLSGFSLTYLRGRTIPVIGTTTQGECMPLDLDLDYQLKLEPGLDQFGIGLIGAGFIIRDCHLPAYAQARFRVLGICSRTPGRA